MQMLLCFICLSKSGVRDNGKRVFERPRAKERSIAVLMFIDELLLTDSVPSFFLDDVQNLFRKKTFSASFAGHFFYGFRNRGATRTSKPFSNIKVKIVAVS